MWRFVYMIFFMIIRSQQSCSPIIIYGIAFGGSRKGTQDSGVLVRVSRFSQGYKSNRVVLNVMPKESAELLNQSNQRALQLACADAPSVGLLGKRIVLDAGHGGSQRGCRGLFGLEEKKISLDIVQRLKLLLEKEGAHVILTRNADVSLSLSERSRVAHQSAGDLIVSVHANTASNKTASGVETFHLDDAIREKSAVFFAHGSGEKKLVESINLLEQQNVIASKNLANHIQHGILSSASTTGYEPRDRGVKKEAFCLFLHSQMPARIQSARFVPVSLVEVGFVSNAQEAKRLADSGYRQVVARGICDGIKNYLTERQ